jgi:hypothetical protein
MHTKINTQQNDPNFPRDVAYTLRTIMKLDSGIYKEKQA